MNRYFLEPRKIQLADGVSLPASRRNDEQSTIPSDVANLETRMAAAGHRGG